MGAIKDVILRTKKVITVFEAEYDVIKLLFENYPSGYM